MLGHESVDGILLLNSFFVQTSDTVFEYNMGPLEAECCIDGYVFPPFFVNAEPVHLGQEGADEPPTLTKEDLLSSGAVRQSTPDTQVDGSKDNRTIFPDET